MESKPNTIMPIKIFKKIIHIILFLLLISGICSCPMVGRNIVRYYDKCEICGDVVIKEEVHIDERFNEKEIREIRDGIREINWGMCGIEEIREGRRYRGEIEMMEEVVRGRGYMIIRLEVGSELIIESMGEKTLGFAGMGSRYMYLVPGNMREGDMSKVVVHEYMHMKGIGHNQMGEKLKGCIGEKESKELRKGRCERWCY